MDVKFGDLGTCPVCHLDLRPGIPLEVHLDTHPKEMIVDALMAWMRTPSQSSSAAVASPPPPPPASPMVPFVKSTTTTKVTNATTMLQRNVQQFVDYRSDHRSIVRDQQQQFHHQQQNGFVHSDYFYHQQQLQQQQQQYHQPVMNTMQVHSHHQQQQQHNQEQLISQGGGGRGEAENQFIESTESYIQDEQGNFILCSAVGDALLPIATKRIQNSDITTPAAPAYDIKPPSDASSSSSSPANRSPEKREMNINPPEYSVAIQDKQKQLLKQAAVQNKSGNQQQQQLSAKEAPKILSVSVLGPKDNIHWPRTVHPEANRLSPNAVLPTPFKRNCANVSTSISGAEPIPGTSKGDVTVRPVATSVIRATVTEVVSVKEECAIDKSSENLQPNGSPVKEEVEADNKGDRGEEVLTMVVIPSEQQPSTSGNNSVVIEQNSEQSKQAVGKLRKEARLSKTPKILKVTFKKPIHVEPTNEDQPQPSTSRMPTENANESHRESSSPTSGASNSATFTNWTEAVREGESSGQMTEEVIAGPSNTAETIAPGFLLKAEACEELYISQHSLIKMEAEEENYCFPGASDILVAMSESKGGGRLEHEELGEGPSMKLYMDLKSESGPSIVEELCLSESSVSVCSMVHGVVERMNVNIRAEEVMPAKGEISEQESNADSELLWPSNAIEAFGTSQILPSYDTSVARECWNFGNASASDNLTFNDIPKLSSLLIGLAHGPTIKSEAFHCESETGAGPSDITSTSITYTEPSSSSSSSKAHVRRSKPYNCPGCPETFRLFRQRKDHIIAHHEELLSKKQRYNYLRQCDKLDAARELTLLSVGGNGDRGGEGGGGFAPHFGPAATFTRRIEQLSVIKLHRFLIEFNLKALKETELGQLDEFKGLMVDFSQRRVYFCTSCRQQFTTMREYRKHMSVHPVQCHTCEVVRIKSPSVVKREGEMDGELMPVATEKIKMEDGQPGGCSTVVDRKGVNELIVVEQQKQQETTFWNWRRFVEHQKMHLGLKEVNTCKQCGKSFLSRRKLNLHASTHSRKTYHCTFCPRTFMHFFRLKEHKKRFHFNSSNNRRNPLNSGGLGGNRAGHQKDYLCPCGEVFQSAAKFAWHMETHDKNPKGCPYCRERFVHKNSLSRHIRLAHQDKYSEYKKDTLPCPVCNNRYIRTSLKTHLASHMKRPEFQCSICSKILSTKWNLKIHRWTHNSRTQMPFKCPTCPKAFMRASDLQTHINTHKSIRPFTCDYCGCQFSRKYNWVRHTREHETEKRFRCVHCGKTFHRAYYLKEHSRSHTNERPFECTICGKTSTTKTNHNKHLKIHHARDVAATEG